jgi:hypothetical protein
MRSLTWSRGRAYLAETPDAWPNNAHWLLRSGVRQQLRLPAEALGTTGAVSLQRACPNASGASYFARMGGYLSAGPVGILEVTLEHPNDPDADEVLAAVIEGLTTMPAKDRPAGHLEIAWFLIHPVDLKIHVWRDTAAAMCRLLCDDVPMLDDAAVITLVREYSARTVHT